jgi:hypothetical protein
VWWAERYLKDYLCGVGDYVSLGFGLISVFSERMTAVVRSDGIFFTFFFIQIILDGSAVIWLYDRSVGIFFTFPLNYFGRASRS